MKKIVLAVALIFSVTFAGAQSTFKNAADAQNAVTKARTASQDPKKAVKPATWISLADALIGAFDQPVNDVLVGSQQTEVKMLLREQKVLSSTQETVQGQAYVVDHYSNKDLYYNASGILEFFVITKPAVEGDILAEAQAALLKASELDVKKSKKDDINKKMVAVHDRFANIAVGLYYAGQYAPAAKSFISAVECFASPVVGQVDSLSTYYAAFVSAAAGDKETAKKYYQKCIEYGYYQEGNVFSNLSAIYSADKDNDTAKKVLEEGFAKYPQSQGVLIGLINLYRTTGDDPQKLFDLLHQAQKNEPNNASLYYVEGDIYKQMKDYENAEKFFYKSTEIDPKYVFGAYSVGAMYYEQAVDIQSKAAEELDDAKYNALMKDFEATLEKAIAPFEKAFEITDDAEIKAAVAEYLKNIYFRFRSKGDSYQQAFDKYNEIYNNSKK